MAELCNYFCQINGLNKNLNFQNPKIYVANHHRNNFKPISHLHDQYHSHTHTNLLTNLNDFWSKKRSTGRSLRCVTIDFRFKIIIKYCFRNLKITLLFQKSCLRESKMEYLVEIQFQQKEPSNVSWNEVSLLLGNQNCNVGHIRTVCAAFVTSAVHTLISFPRGKLVGCMKGLTAVVFSIEYCISLFSEHPMVRILCVFSC